MKFFFNVYIHTHFMKLLSSECKGFGAGQGGLEASILLTTMLGRMP